MDWDQLNKLIKHRKQSHLQDSEDVFDEATSLAYANGLVLRRMGTSSHFQIINFSEPYWIYNLYPSTQRIYSDPNHRGPFLKVNKPWNLLDVVKAAVKK